MAGKFRFLKKRREKKRAEEKRLTSLSRKSLERYCEGGKITGRLRAQILHLSKTDFGIRRLATDALGKLGDKRAVEPLIVALKDEDFVLRRAAIMSLAELGDRRAVEPLITALKDNDSSVRRSAAWRLGKFKDRRAVEPLIVALKGADADVREGAAVSLGELDDKSAVPHLTIALKGDVNFSVRWRAAESLGKLKDRRAVQPLIAALKDTNTYVKEYASWSLGRISFSMVKGSDLKRLKNAQQMFRGLPKEKTGILLLAMALNKIPRKNLPLDLKSKKQKEKNKVNYLKVLRDQARELNSREMAKMLKLGEK